MTKERIGNFRIGYSSKGLGFVAGKNSEQNEMLVTELIKDMKKVKPSQDRIVLHTKAPGSPFVVIEAQVPRVSKQDIKEAAVFCAAFSQAWKKAKIKKDIEVHYFLSRDIYKNKLMPKGTFGVKKFKKIIIKKEDIESFCENKKNV